MIWALNPTIYIYIYIAQNSIDLENLMGTGGYYLDSMILAEQAK